MSARLHETLSTPGWWRASGTGIAVLAIAMLVLVLAAPVTPDRPASTSDLVITWVVSLITAAAGVAVSVATMTVTVDTAVEIRLWPFYRRRVAFRSVERAERIDMRATWSGGWGVRVGLGQGTLVLLDNGPGVRLRLTGMRDVSFRTDDPEAVLAALAAHGVDATAGRSAGQTVRTVREASPEPRSSGDG
ncbi:VOC family protein [Curtobacterium sp. RRHDQ10]|uniref:VOC family protein n=1 Tax=Curtobacterium phyllosphaerae TaxID=3413379 RepID=UPI003BEF6642